MKKRIADIVTSFRATGLRAVTGALGRVATGARQTSQTVNRIGAGLGSAVRAGSRAAISSLQGVGRAGVAAGRQIARAMQGAARAARAIAVRGLQGAGAAGLAAGGLLGIAGRDTIAQMRDLRQASELLGIDPEVLSNWQQVARGIGMEANDLSAVFTAFGTSIAESLDPESEFAKLFRYLGIQTRDASGRIRNLSDLMGDFAVRTAGIDDAQRRYAYGIIFGEGDALKVAELLKDVGADYDAFQTEFQRRQKAGLLVTQEQLDIVAGFQRQLANLQSTFGSIKREFFIAAVPTLNRYMTGFNALFEQDRSGFVDRFLTKPFERALALLKDIVTVFTGFDIDAELFGGQRRPVQNTWLFRVRDMLLELRHVGVGLAYVFIGLGKAFLNFWGLVDRAMRQSTGRSIVEWLGLTGTAEAQQRLGALTRSFAAFAGDVGRILSSAFAGPIDLSRMETASGLAFARMLKGIAAFSRDVQALFGVSLSQPFDADALETGIGQAIGRVVETVRKGMDDARTYIVTSWMQAQEALANGSGIAAVNTLLGELIYMASSAVGYLSDLWNAVEEVFGGNAAPEGFEWVGSLRDAFVHVRDVVVELAGLLGPLFAGFDELTKELLGINGGSALILGKIGLDLFSSAPLPVTLVAIAAGVGALLFSWLKPDAVSYASDNEAAENVAVRERMDADLDAAGGPKAGARDAYASSIAGYDERDRSLITQIIDFEERRARERESDAERSLEAEMGRVDLTATGTPVVINLPTGGTSTGIFPADQADALTRSLNARIGGR